MTPPLQASRNLVSGLIQTLICQIFPVLWNVTSSCKKPSQSENLILLGIFFRFVRVQLICSCTCVGMKNMIGGPKARNQTTNPKREISNERLQTRIQSERPQMKHPKQIHLEQNPKRKAVSESSQWKGREFSRFWFFLIETDNTSHV